MSDWKIAMVCLLPLLAMGSPVRLFGFPVPSGRKLRTWLALFGAAVAASFFAADNIIAFAVIDAIGAWLVLGHPRGETQRAIGLLFVGMLFLHIGFFIAGWMQPGSYDATGYANYNRLLGWLQWAFLALWGGGDAVARIIRDSRGGDDSLLARDGL